MDVHNISFLQFFYNGIIKCIHPPVGLSLNIFVCVFIIYVHLHLQKPIMKEIYLAGGCFWGTEHYFKQMNGVISTETGFANGKTENPTYEEVYTDTTGFAETIKVVYDERRISLRFLIDMFFHAIDPTLVNRQGHDVGTRYRTGVYYVEETDRAVIEAVFQEKQKQYADPIVTELEPLHNYYPASEYHQDYLDKHPDGYCHLPVELFRFAKEATESAGVSKMARIWRSGF